MQAPSRQAAIERIHEYIDSGRFESELATRVAFRTESQKCASGDTGSAESLAELHRYLDDEIIPAFESCGFNCKKYENPLGTGGPFMLATRTEAEGLPVVLGYGHGDVILGQDAGQVAFVHHR